MLATGAAVGSINGFLIVKGRLPQPLIVTLATLGVASGLALIVSNGEVKPEVSAGASAPPARLRRADPGARPARARVRPRLYCGRRRPSGGDGSTRSAGIPMRRGGWAFQPTGSSCRPTSCAGVTAAIAGIIVAGRTGTGSPTAGTLLELDAITAVIIGGASLAGGRGSVINVIAGALILGVIRNGLDLLGVTPSGKTSPLERSCLSRLSSTSCAGPWRRSSASAARKPASRRPGVHRDGAVA